MFLWLSFHCTGTCPSTQTALFQCLLKQKFKSNMTSSTADSMCWMFVGCIFAQSRHTKYLTRKIMTHFQPWPVNCEQDYCTESCRNAASHWCHIKCFVSHVCNSQWGWCTTMNNKNMSVGLNTIHIWTNGRTGTGAWNTVPVPNGNNNGNFSCMSKLSFNIVI